VSQIEELYNRHAVKIISNGIEGSGCIFQPNNVEYSYVFTAKHCLIDKIDLERDKISIHRFKDLEMSLTIQDVYLHAEHDIAIIKVDKITDLNISRIHIPEKGQSVSIYGYPIYLKGEEEPRHNIDCKIGFRRDFHSEIESDKIQFSFNKSMPETIVGFSGSGVFCEENNDLSIVGVLTRLKASDGVYSTLCAYHITLFEDLIVENGLPSIYTDNFTNLVKDPKVLDQVFALSYTLDSEPYYLNRNIDEVFIRFLSSPKHIWVSGISGLGKTFLVFRNIKQKSITPIHIDLTCFGTNKIIEFFEHINNELVEQNDIQMKSEKLNIYERISDNLSKIIFKEQGIIIFVDEVPILDKTIFYDFLSGFISISEKYANLISIKNKIKWIISTRINPSLHLQNTDSCLLNKQKAIKNFIFKDLGLWEKPEIVSLLELLQSGLNFTLSRETESKIVEMSDGFPGRVKSTFERLMTENCTIEEAIEMVKSENI
jgi:Trypsin.